MANNIFQLTKDYKNPKPPNNHRDTHQI